MDLGRLSYPGNGPATEKGNQRHHVVRQVGYERRPTSGKNGFCVLRKTAPATVGFRKKARGHDRAGIAALYEASSEWEKNKIPGRTSLTPHFRRRP